MDIKESGENVNVCQPQLLSETNGAVVEEPRKGYAPVKKEYLVTERKRQLASEYLPKEVARELKEKLEQQGEANNGGPIKNGEKLKGRNRNNERPVFKAAAHNLCTFVARGFDDDKCPFGESCRNSHDIAAYVPKREPDIADKCFCYETYGRCRFGVLCRFGGGHIKEDGSNIIDEEKWSKTKESPLTYNELTKELQTALRKRSVSFPRTKEFNATRSKVTKKADDMVPGNEGSVEPLTVAEPTAPAPKAEPAPEPRIGMDCDRSSVARKLKVKEMLKKPYLSPLTTLGNLPFRRVCTEFGAEITCGEMAMAGQLLQGHAAEWALLRRHSSEKCFGVQLCGGNPDMLARCAELITERLNVDFIDLNAACPIDLVCQKGEGAAMMARPSRLLNGVSAIRSVTSLPVSVKLRTGMGDCDEKRFAHELMPMLADAGADFVAIHGRTRDQRYTRSADWNYLARCAAAGAEKSMPVFGVGDTMSYEDFYGHLENTGVGTVVVARGALIKPWIFTEIAERRHWDISSSERFDMMRRYANYGLEHWGSDTRGVETTRRFLLEWQSFLYRYIPVGLLEVVPQRINERPPAFFGRNDLETLMASANCADWIKLSEMILGPVPENFTFLPKHKANAYQ